MTDIEFDVIDELYFVTSFQELKKNLTIGEGQLKTILKELMDKGWVKCFESVSEETTLEEIDSGADFQDLHFLATKAGLLVHNGRG